MAAKRAKKGNAVKPLENENISKVIKALEKVQNKGKWQNSKLKRKAAEEAGQEEEKSTIAAEEDLEVPFVDVLPLPNIEKQADQRQAESTSNQPGVVGPIYKNKAPLQFDERARDLIAEALKIPINLTTEDLLNVSEAARIELKKLLTKKRLERKTVAVHQESDESALQVAETVDMQRLADIDDDLIDAASLPEATYEISTEDKEGVPKGSLIVSDPVLQYFNTMLPGEKPKTVIVASESQSLRSVYPLINGVGEVEALLDGGSQIVSMSKAVAVELEIPWDPDITVQMQSANRSLEQTLGLAKNVPFLFGHITVYLQVHVIGKPAYKVLLGRPFDCITESVVKNDRDGGQSLTLTDPNTGERCVMHTHERGKTPTVLKRPKKADFQPSMI